MQCKDRGAMLSSKGAKTVRLQKKKSGLDFSVKGGKEHGIPIVVSWIKEGGVASTQLRLGDEILAVSGRSLQGLTHTDAVHLLREAGPTVVLRVKPNQVLEDVFSSSHNSQLMRTPVKQTDDSHHFLQPPSPSIPKSQPLPLGWVQKVDQKTGRVYYENSYTQTTTWADPRALTPVPLGDFQWNQLPPGWERFLDPQGDMYYVNHDTQTTHWDCPRGLRQQRQLEELRAFVQEEREKLKVNEEELKQNRELVLEKNRRLDNPTISSPPPDPEEEMEEVGDEKSDLYDDIMMLNEEVELQDSHVCRVRGHLKQLGEVLRQAQNEDIGETDEYRASAELAVALVTQFAKYKALEGKLNKVVGSITELQRKAEVDATPLSYMLQLPPTQSTSEVEEVEKWLHVLPDRLTGKTNCEMRVELCLFEECYTYGGSLLHQLSSFFSRAAVAHGSWEKLMEELAGCDFTPLNDHWLKAGFREKLQTLITF